MRLKPQFRTVPLQKTLVNSDMKLHFLLIKELMLTLKGLWLFSLQFSSVQSLSRVLLFATPWIAARQASLSITNSRSSPKLMSIESVMPSNHLILCHPLLLLPPIPPSIRVFSNESTLRVRWLKYWSFSFSIIPSKEIPGLISFWSGCLRGSILISWDSLCLFLPPSFLCARRFDVWKWLRVLIPDYKWLNFCLTETPISFF